MNDEAPKSAYDLAMERLRKKDADAGIEQVPLSDTQRAEIAEARNFYDSKLAEREVLHHSTLRKVAEPEARAVIEAEYHRDRERFIADRESKIAKIRRNV
ncbi:MAG: hypothetical protein AABY89_02050 [Acidobacteriota bacterium]